jgi:RecA/RadA recombinase
MSEEDEADVAEGEGKKKKPRRTIFSHPALAARDAISAVSGLVPVTFTRAARLVNVISSHSLSIDLILGCGFASGKYVTIFGPEGCGKSTLAQELMASCQVSDVTVVLYDYEAGTDPVYMRAQGADVDHTVAIQAKKVPWSKRKTGYVNVDDFIPFNPENGEQVYEHILETLGRMPRVKQGGPPRIVFIIDSQSSMQSRAIDEFTGKGQMAANANMHSKFLGLIKPKLATRGGLLFGINQMRSQIGSWGNPEQEAGGKAIRYYADVKLLMTRRKQEIDKSGLTIVPVTLRTVKNKLFIPFRVLDDFGIVLGRGIDKALDTRQFLKKLGMCRIERGKIRILTPKYRTKFLSWSSFRTIAEDPKFRAYCFSLLREDDTYRLFYKTDKVLNLSYDKVEEKPRKKRRAAAEADAEATPAPKRRVRRKATTATAKPAAAKKRRKRSAA